MLHTVLFYMFHALVFAMMLSIGVSVRRKDLAEIIHRPRLYVRALLVMELAIPLFAMAMVMVCRVPPRASALIMLMAICPGAPFIPFVTKTKGETHSAVGLNLLVIASVLAPLTLPIWTAVLDRIYPFDVGITPLQVLEKTVPTIIAPLAIGLVLRMTAPRVADVVGRVARYFFLVALAVAVAVGLVAGARVLVEVPLQTFLAVLLVVTGSALMGYWAASPQPEARRVTGVSMALGNPGLALAIVAASYPGVKAIAFIAAYVIFRKLALIPFEQWVKHHDHPSAHPPALDTHAVGTV